VKKSTFFYARATFFHAQIIFFHAGSWIVKKSNSSVKKSNFSVKKRLFFTLASMKKKSIWQRKSFEALSSSTTFTCSASKMAAKNGNGVKIYNLAAHDSRRRRLLSFLVTGRNR
jgi:hypothetical protein